VLAVRALREADYRFDGYRNNDDEPARLARRVQLVVAPDIEEQARESIRVAVATANGVALARDLGNTPANVCTPAYLAETMQALGKAYGLDVEVFEREQIETMGLGAFLAVARGSVQPPKLIVIRHKGGAPEQAPVALVGKGVTFDSGGISIKPALAMEEMKYDMGGAASVLGTLLACAELALPIHVVGVVVACENMPAGNALKPGDVVRSLSGKQIEVLNTDAEGRLILCDALTYVQRRFSPALTIDIATLTGACVIALGHVHSGLYANDDALADALLAAGAPTCDTAWRMPLDDEYQEALKSTFADVVNLGGRAGSITAACFLQRFVDGPWAHLDIAGTAWQSDAKKGGTGRPVPLLTQFLVDRAATGVSA
jgi:leucyl aminopeptidase